MLKKLLIVVWITFSLPGYADCKDVLQFLAATSNPPTWFPRRSPKLDPGRTYFLQLTYFKPTSVDLQEHGRLSGEIHTALRTASGYVAHSMFANRDTNQFWTISIWETQTDMFRFHGSPVHVAAMRRYPSIEEKEFPGREVIGLTKVPEDWRPLLNLLFD
jgi:heme-degrading monooxygenase HmoA